MNAALIIGSLTGQDVFLQINAPPRVEAGSTVNIEIELNKANAAGFARFHQELPPGVTASPVYPAEMSFSYEDNTVKMIWLNLPGEEKITLNYKIHVDERLKGDLNLTGTFSYIENNQRKSVTASGALLAISPSPAIEERFITEIKDADKGFLASPPFAGSAENILAIRQDPVPDNDLGFIVNILVNKEGGSHFAKIEEEIPRGYTAVEMESQGGIFSFTGQKAKIIWKNLPAEELFTVSYRLIPDSETDDTPDVKGEFSFMHNEITTTRRVFQKDTDLKSLTESEKTELVALVSSELPVPEIATVPAERLSGAGRETRINPETAPGTTVSNSLREISNPLKAEPGVYYRVQLAAGRSPVYNNRYFSRLNVTDDVYTELHEGWFKYSIGSFRTYSSARNHRVHIWNTTPVDDAFVTAYNEGLRITVQEALMISNQRWYR